MAQRRNLLNAFLKGNLKLSGKLISIWKFTAFISQIVLVNRQESDFLKSSSQAVIYLQLLDDTSHFPI